MDEQEVIEALRNVGQKLTAEEAAEMMALTNRLLAIRNEKINGV